MMIDDEAIHAELRPCKAKMMKFNETKQRQIIISIESPFSLPLMNFSSPPVLS